MPAALHTYYAYFLLCFAGLTAAKCPEGWNLLPGGSKCYFIDNSVATFDENKVLCQSLDATMVYLHSEAEDDFLRAITEEFGIHWLGGEQVKEGDFRWLDGTLLDYNKWKNFRPACDSRQQCCAMAWNHLGWFDDPCHHKRRQICQRFAEKTSQSNDWDIDLSNFATYPPEVVYSSTGSGMKFNGLSRLWHKMRALMGDALRDEDKSTPESYDDYADESYEKVQKVSASDKAEVTANEKMFEFPLIFHYTEVTKMRINSTFGVKKPPSDLTYIRFPCLLPISYMFIAIFVLFLCSMFRKSSRVLFIFKRGSHSEDNQPFIA